MAARARAASRRRAKLSMASWAFLAFFSFLESFFFFGGTAAWTTRIHWNVLPKEMRVPWVLSKAELDVVARPTLLRAAPRVA